VTKLPLRAPDKIQEIISKDELSFAVFCIENVAECLKLSGSAVYKLLTEDSDILDSYLVPSYDALHTQDKEYIVNDIIEYMREEGLIK
jgi:hypothetical protein